MKSKLYLLFCLFFVLDAFATKPLVQWAKVAGGYGDESAFITSVDHEGSVFVAGTSKSNTFSFNNTTLTNDNPSFVSSYLAKYDANGNLLWVKGGGNGNSYSIVAMDNDREGNTYISGSFQSSTLKFGNFTLENHANYTYGKVFVAKYDRNGNVAWAIAPDIYISSGTGGLCVDSTGNFYITGHFQDVTMTFGTVKLTNTSSPQQDVFLVKFNSSGKALWGRNFGGTWHDVGRSVAIDSDGDIMLAGIYKSSVFNIGNIHLTNNDQNTNNVFLAKITTDGQVLWAKGMGALGEDFCKSVATDKSGNSFICGHFKSQNIGFGNIQLQNSTQSTKSFLAKYDSQGNALWAKTSESNGVDDFATVTVDKTGNSYVCGSFDKSKIVYDTTNIINQQGTAKDIIVVKYNEAGIVEWAKNFGDNYDAAGNSCSLDTEGNLFVAGDFKSEAIYFDDFKMYNSTFQTNSAVVSSDIFLIKIKQLADSITVKYCSSDNTVTLYVDVDGSKYNWVNHQSGDTISGTAKFIATNPIVGDKYSCLITLDGGGIYELNIILVDYNLKADFNYSISVCRTNTIQFVENVLSTHEPVEYKWYFGDGNESKERNPIHSYQTSGKYKVKLEVTNPLSSCPDTITKEIEVFSPMSVEIQGDTLCCKGYTLTMRAVGAPAYLWSDGSTADTLVVNENSGRIWVVGLFGGGICQSDTVFKTIISARYPVTVSGYQTYCPELATKIKAHGAKDYFWSTGISADSIEISAPGGNYWVYGQSAGGCYSDTLHFSVSEEPDWDFSISGQLSFCKSDSTQISVNGSVSNVWFNSETKNSIFISKPGDYSVAGVNSRGCEKHLNFTVTENESPNSIFSVSTKQVDRKNNTLAVIVNPEPDTEYFWEMGDGSFVNGASHQHVYNVRNNMLEFIVRLTATNKYGCVSYTEQSIDVVPFIPNVFTPNGDGINDVFVPDIDVLIIDRLGKSLYRGTEGWDGTFRGKEVPNDTYFYFVYYADKYGVVQTKKGTVTLIR